MPRASADFNVRWSWQATHYVTLKILTNGLVDKSAASTELEMSRCIATTDPKAEGLRQNGAGLIRSDWTGLDTCGLGLRAHEGTYHRVPTTFRWSTCKLFREAANSNRAYRS